MEKNYPSGEKVIVDIPIELRPYLDGISDCEPISEKDRDRVRFNKLLIFPLKYEFVEEKEWLDMGYFVLMIIDFRGIFLAGIPMEFKSQVLKISPFSIFKYKEDAVKSPELREFIKKSIKQFENKYTL
jgi:hypothetical protein